jgi:catechol 2,3-dioxygenase
MVIIQLIDLIDAAVRVYYGIDQHSEPKAMSLETAPRLSHVGLYVTDVPKMIDFYTSVLGFVVSDGAEDGRITFLSRNPSDHHQVVLVRGRETELEIPMVQQVSFNVGTLASVQRAFRKISEAGCEGIRPVSHGNAWSVYFRDPEGNRLEVYTDTPWYVHQPVREVMDFDLPEEELLRRTEAVCRTLPGFATAEEWRRKTQRAIDAYAPE